MATPDEQEIVADVDAFIAGLRRSVNFPSWSKRVRRHSVRLEGARPDTELVIDVDHERHGSLEFRYPLWERDVEGVIYPTFEMRTLELDMIELP